MTLHHYHQQKSLYQLLAVLGSLVPFTIPIESLYHPAVFVNLVFWVLLYSYTTIKLRYHYVVSNLDEGFNMLIERITETTDKQTTYTVYVNGEPEGSFSDSNDPIALSRANDLMEDLIQQASIHGICPQVRYK